MFRSNLSARSLRAALLTGAATATVFAFTGPVAAQEAETSETVVVTGSRLPQTGLTSVSPVNVIGKDEAQLEGTVTVETLLNNLPSTFAGFSTHDANGSTGTASVNLRGLGAARTLVLIDGRRMMPGDPRFPVADLNAIPTAMVERVEVLTGGASAVYGSDAIAGVVNFIMRKDFEGIEFEGQYTVYNDDNDVPVVSREIDRARAAGGGALLEFQHAPKNIWDGDTIDGTILMGVNSDNGKGNITAYIGYRRLSAVTQADREYSACSLAARAISPPGPGIENVYRCQGSLNKNTWTSLDNYYAGNYPYYFFQEGTGAPGSGTFVPSTFGTKERFNFAPYNHIQRPDTRWTGGFFAHYEVEPWLDFYSSFMFVDDRTLASIAPSGLFLGQGAGGQPFMFVNCDNPLMTAQERQVMCTQAGLGPTDTATVFIGRRNIEGGPRSDDIRHTAYRMIFGAKGDLGDGWSYDVFGQYGYSIFSQLTSGYFSISKAQNALLVDPATGDCFTDPARCVPLDIFNGIGSITPEMQAYIAATGLQTGFTQEKILGGAIVGDLGSIGFMSPWAKNPFAVVFGAEYRSEGMKFDASSDFSSQDLGGGGGAIFSRPFADFSVREVFAELRIPLIEDAPFAKLLQIHGAYRYSDYSSAGSVNTYSYDAEWQPIDDFRLRASYQRATRAPNVLELFAPQSVGLFGGTDPCSAAANPSASTLANCMSSHPNPEADVPNAGSGILNCISAQCGANFGGNPGLAPEVSDTKSYGIVLTPTFLPGFSATVDYFDIEVKDFIGIIPPNLTLTQCYVENNQFFCALVHRTPALHQVTAGGFVEATNQNTGSLGTKGVDIAANYQTDLADWDMGNNGSLAFSFLGTWLDELVTQALPGFPSYDCVGFYGLVCGTPNPEWRHKFRFTWSSPWDVDLSVQWRHFAGVDLDIDDKDPLLGGGPNNCPPTGLHGACDLIDARIDAFDYFDISGVWHVWENVELRGGVNNIFNEVPPLADSNTFGLSSPAFGNGNTFPNVYDPMGRTVFVGATVKM